MKQITCTVNGEEQTLLVEEGQSLQQLLRDQLGLTSVKCGCDTKNCGACRVILNGNAVNSCAVQAENVAGKQIETTEGLADGWQLHPLQQAFIDAGAVQCGFCTPGMLMSAKALLDKTSDPDEEAIRKVISGNLCRCTGYVKIVEAILLAARRMKEDAK